jgi:hypothetical protein
VALTGFAVLIVLGCGDDTGLGKRYPVSGSVTYKDQPVEKGRIDFIPAESNQGRAASGEIVDGRYALTTAISGDGAMPGKYKVTVVSKEWDSTTLQGDANGGQFHHDKNFAKAVENAKDLVPAKFGLAETSGLTAEVKEQSNQRDFELKDEGLTRPPEGQASRPKISQTLRKKGRGR